MTVWYRVMVSVKGQWNLYGVFFHGSCFPGLEMGILCWRVMDCAGGGGSRIQRMCFFMIDILVLNWSWVRVWLGWVKAAQVMVG